MLDSGLIFLWGVARRNCAVFIYNIKLFLHESLHFYSVVEFLNRFIVVDVLILLPIYILLKRENYVIYLYHK